MSTYSRVVKAIHDFEAEKGFPPEALILDSFTHEKLKLEVKEGPEDTIGTLKSIAGVQAFRFESVVML